MNLMNIAFFGLRKKDAQDYFSQHLHNHTLAFYPELHDANLPRERNFEIISVFVGAKVTKEVIDAFPNLKFICTRSTGFDHIDTGYAKQKGIVVSNVPAYGSHTVAEFTFSLILELSRKTYLGIERIKREQKFNHEGLEGFDLSGKTLGVIGTGKIGLNVIQIAKGFGMNVYAYDVSPNHEQAKQMGFHYYPLSDVLQRSDIVTLHVPYNDQTHYLISKDNIRTLKKGSYLINTARGGVVDTQALFEALNDNHLAGAALDVLEEEHDVNEENILDDHILNKLSQVIITPHMAFYTKEAENNIIRTTLDNINGFLENIPINVVTKDDN